MKRTLKFLERVGTDIVENDLDAMILVIGDEGVGKSTYILEMLWLYQQIRDNNPTVDSVLDRIVHDDRTEFRRQLLHSDPKQAHAAMDAAHIMHKREQMVGDQREVAKSLLDIRTFNYLILLGYQDWRDVSDQLQRRRARWTFRIPRRGHVYAYNRRQMDKKYETGTWPEEAFHDTFPDLSGTELWEEFDRRDEKRKRERLDLDDNPDVDDVYRREQTKTAIRAVKPWDDENGMTFRDAAKLTDYSRGWVSDRIQEWKDGHHRDLLDDDELVTAAPAAG